MPITIGEFRTPRWTKRKERYPYSEDKKDRFATMVCPLHYEARYHGEPGAGTGWKQGGYNPNHNSVSIERIRVDSDSITFKRM